jgi:dipeptidyl aminopeptidase/acylaminoacyl peptidase
VLYIQGTNDIAHPRVDLDRFVAQYRKAGGQVELVLFEGEAEGFIIREPSSPASGQALEKIIAFVRQQVRSSGGAPHAGGVRRAGEQQGGTSLRGKASAVP